MVKKITEIDGTIPERCETCRFFYDLREETTYTSNCRTPRFSHDRIQESINKNTKGECRRYPPKASAGISGRFFVRVGIYDWCGEFKL